MIHLMVLIALIFTIGLLLVSGPALWLVYGLGLIGLAVAARQFLT